MNNNNYNVLVNLKTHKVTGVIDCFDTYYSEAPYMHETGASVFIVADESFLAENGLKDVQDLLGYYYVDGKFVNDYTSPMHEAYSKFRMKVNKYNNRRIRSSFSCFSYKLYKSLYPTFLLRIVNCINQFSLNIQKLFIAKKFYELSKDYSDFEYEYLTEFYKDKEYKYEFGACLLIKDENDYLEEFLDGNYKAGVDHFYIYDNKSATPIAETLKTIKDGFYVDKCDVILFTEYTYMQFDCYKHCMDNYGHECHWLTFIDTDEILESATEFEIKDYLMANYDKAMLWIPWILYNANGHIDRVEGLQQETFTNIISAPYGTYGKCIVQPHYIARMFVHYAQAKYKSIYPTPVVQLDVEFFSKKHLYEGRADKCGYTILLKHYICRSYEEWVTKMSRGTCDPIYDRKFKEFFVYNPDLYYLTEKSEVKKKLNEKQLYDN